MVDTNPVPRTLGFAHATKYQLSCFGYKSYGISESEPLRLVLGTGSQ